MKIINVAIIGCGAIAEKHALILNSKKNKNYKLIAVCDLKKEKAKNFAKKFNLNYFDNIDKLLTSTNIDLLVVCTSSGSHYEIALQISKYKKNVIIEKPICLNLNQAKKIIKIYKKNKNLLFVVMQNRFNPALKLLKKSIEKNLFGKISSLSVRVWWSRNQSYYNKASWRGTWKNDGGIFMNQAIHHLDMMTWLLGPVRSVTAVIKRRLVKIETEDVGTAILEFKNGCLGTIEASTAVRPKNLENSVTVLGENGNIKISGNYMNYLEIYEFKNKIAKNLLKQYKNENKMNKSNHYLFYQNVLKNLLIRDNYKKDKNVINGNEAIKSLELVSAIYQSVINNSKVFLPVNLNIKNSKSKLMKQLKEKNK